MVRTHIRPPAARCSTCFDVGVYYTTCFHLENPIPTKGTPVYPVRLDDDLVDEMKLAVQRRNLFSARAPWTFSDFIRTAVREKLDKMERSRRPRGKPSVPLAGDGAIA